LPAFQPISFNLYPLTFFNSINSINLINSINYENDLNDLNDPNDPNDQNDPNDLNEPMNGIPAMKLKIKVLISAIAFSLLIALPLQASNMQRFTATLLPVKEAGRLEDGSPDKGMLWIQNNPPREIFLQFDLSGLPPDLQEADFQQCTLRLVAGKVVYQPAGNPNTGSPQVSVKGWLAKDDFSGNAGADSIISLSQIYDHDSGYNKIARKATKELRQAVIQEYSGDKKISLRLFSENYKASSLFYPGPNSDLPVNPSNFPRLVIEYTQGPPSLLETLSWSQYQHDPEHTGRSSWIPFRNPSGFVADRIDLTPILGPSGTVADYPLIYQGNIYLVAMVDARNILTALGFAGQTLWQQDLGTGTIQRAPVISRQGIIYIATENQIRAYDLNQRGKAVASGSLAGKPGAYTDLTVGNDGSLFVAVKENDLNYIYGFTPDLTPFIKSDPLGSGAQNISTVSVSPDGQKIFAQAPAGAAVIDITDPVISGLTKPAPQQTIELENGRAHAWQYYHTPVAGPAGEVMMFADFTDTANAGNVWAYTPAERVWNAAGTLIPQPVIGANGLVYFIQGGALIGHLYSNREDPEIKAGTDLKTTSNLVVDGADNIYYWDNGYLHGYTAEGTALFDRIPMTSQLNERSLDQNGKPVQGPEKFLRLMLGPDGTLWSNNKHGNALFAFKPRYTEPDLTLKQADLKTATVYRASGRLTVAAGGVTLAKGTDIVLQAQKGIAFSTGFRVEKGADLLCRTGF